ncbi:alpha/beta fold hydrolase, partial [bacterium]
KPRSIKFRVHGQRPYQVVLVHGGPGAAGEMAPVAQTLASDWGVLEPFQTADSVQGQVNELKEQLQSHADCPVILIGFSWGAWLSYLMAAYYPELVEKLILISSGPFETHYAEDIQKTRMNRLNEHDKAEVENIIQQLSESNVANQNQLFSRFGSLVSKADAYDPIANETEDEMIYNIHIFHEVWPEAAALRESSRLLKIGKQIQCPVVAIHGDYDPHPVEGVRKPLSQVLTDFKFVLLEKCGHKPWIEKQARERFFQVLRDELKVS